MKSIIASDLHGNLKYTEQLIKYIKIENPDYIFLLGDLFGSNPKEIAALLNPFSDKIYAVCGNCDIDEHLKLLKFNGSQAYISITIDDEKLFLTHGHELYRYLKESENCQIIQGHTHVYNIYGNHINPGSVGFPRVNSEHTCILKDKHQIFLINLEDLSILDSTKNP